MLMPPVSRYMTVHPYAISPRDQVASARQIMATRNIHHLPVVDDRRLVGVLSDRDITRATGSVAALMTQEVLAVTPDAPLDEVLGQMEAKSCGSAVVVGDRGIEGIFTVHDALRALGDLLRRVVEEEP
jgi:CBS domain-containing protein